MKLYLIRHAESVGNVNGNLTATTDFELTDKGVKQAKRLGEALRKELAGKTVQAYCSPLSRAKQTLNEILKWCDAKVDKVVECSDLKEMNLGKLEGMPFDQQSIEYPEVDLGTKLTYLQAPEGEKYDDVKKRVVSFCQENIDVDNDDAKMLIVSHGITLRVLINSLLDRPDEDVNYLNWFENTAQTVLSYDAKAERFLIERLNDYSHLGELETKNFAKWGFFAKRDAYIMKLNIWKG